MANKVKICFTSCNIRRLLCVRLYDSINKTVPAISFTRDTKRYKLKTGNISYWCSKYLWLTELKGLTTSYGHCFSYWFMAQARSARDKNRKGKTGIRNLSTDRENEVNKIFIISLLCVGRVREQFLTHLESKTSQSETIVKCLSSR